ncbi:hypothetical protein GCM10023142_06060 [Anaerocolumna aminovalerica]|uniref:Uncharacterized protein n=1 Tax=Anaerocolumna aminovalerica TaxID=1527 RepID=A0A1I5CHE0_9FIRM|nr:hypothetical protein [Anaerocolumna aminovalerica]MDU6265027.1 hypothetical protein [Anaerocolumna aminovalerica]SFN86307.1 hypothetical protein SAMN04489757_10359 [Anaerocolumna aminovalerica]
MEDLLTLLNVLQAKRKFFLPFLAFCWIFITCFLFPQPFINKGNSSILFNGLIIYAYSIACLMLLGMININRVWVVFLFVMAADAIGIGSRYILEYGEVSNEINFTLSSTLGYLLIIPFTTTLIYLLMYSFKRWFKL